MAFAATLSISDIRTVNVMCAAPVRDLRGCDCVKQACSITQVQLTIDEFPVVPFKHGEMR
jgi:hypothetical protein